MKQRIKNTVGMLRADPHMQEVVRGTMLAFVLKVMGSALAFGFSVVIARLLGAEGAGLYFMALSVTAIGSVIGRVGLDNALMRLVATHAAHEEWDKVHAVHALGMRLATIVSGTLSLMGFFAASWMAQALFNKPDLAEPLRWMSLAILPFAILNVQAQSLKGLKRIRDAMLLQSIGVPFIGLLSIWPLAVSAGVVGVTWGYLTATTLVACLGIWAWRCADARGASFGGSGQASCYPFADLWVSAKPLFIISLLSNAVLLWAPLFLLGMWVSAAEVGVYGVATRLALLISFLLVTLNHVIAPKFAELHAKGELKAMGQLARRSTVLLTLLTSPLFLALFIYNEQTMALFGPEFTVGGTILAILLVGQLINVMSGSVGELLMMSGNETITRNITTASVALQMILVLTLAPLIGGMGAAIASASALATMNLMTVYAVYRKLGVVTIPGMQVLLREKF